MTTALCPGSFDPVTNGHVDIIGRACSIFDQVYVTVFENPNKKHLFSVQERVDMLRQALQDFPNVVIESYYGLLTDYVRMRQIRVVVKGLRAVSDFEYEFQMAQMNKHLYDELETFFVMARPDHAYLSSSVVKEIAGFNGDVDSLVPRHVSEMLKRKLGKG